MNQSRVSGCLLVASLASGFSASACGSSDKDGGSGKCTTPEIVGSVFGGMGTATVTGTGTLPDGIADGLEVNIMVSSDNFSVGVFPDNLLAANDRVCGKSVRYTAKTLSAGTYRLAFEVPDPDFESNKTLFEGTATSDFTIADGQTLQVDAVFQLTPK